MAFKTPNLDLFDQYLADGDVVRDFPLKPGETAYVAVAGAGESVRATLVIDSDVVFVPIFIIRSGSVQDLLAKVERQAAAFLAGFSRDGCRAVRLARVIRHATSVVTVGGREHWSAEHGFLCTMTPAASPVA